MRIPIQVRWYVYTESALTKHTPYLTLKSEKRTVVVVTINICEKFHPVMRGGHPLYQEIIMEMNWFHSEFSLREYEEEYQSVTLGVFPWLNLQVIGHERGQLIMEPANLSVITECTKSPIMSHLITPRGGDYIRRISYQSSFPWLDFNIRLQCRHYWPCLSKVLLQTFEGYEVDIFHILSDDPLASVIPFQYLWQQNSNRL